MMFLAVALLSSTAMMNEAKAFLNLNNGFGNLGLNINAGISANSCFTGMEYACFMGGQNYSFMNQFNNWNMWQNPYMQGQQMPRIARGGGRVGQQVNWSGGNQMWPGVWNQGRGYADPYTGLPTNNQFFQAQTM